MRISRKRIGGFRPRGEDEIEDKVQGMECKDRVDDRGRAVVCKDDVRVNVNLSLDKGARLAVPRVALQMESACPVS
jgi:hypothetical protein